MKKTNLFTFVAAIVLLCITSSFAPVEHGSYAQLVPGSSKKFVFQIVPDKTHTNVVAYINFYSSDNKRVGQKAFSITDEKEKYVRKDVCTNKVFKFSFDNVSRVKIDHVNENEVLEKDDVKTKGVKINLPVSASALGPIEK